MKSYSYLARFLTDIFFTSSCVESLKGNLIAARCVCNVLRAQHIVLLTWLWGILCVACWLLVPSICSLWMALRRDFSTPLKKLTLSTLNLFGLVCLWKIMSRWFFVVQIAKLRVRDSLLHMLAFLILDYRLHLLHLQRVVLDNFIRWTCLNRPFLAKLFLWVKQHTALLYTF